MPKIRPHVRPAGEDELSHIVAALGDEAFFAERISRQSQDKGVLLVAWLEDEPIGCVRGRREAELREHLPGVPLLHRLWVIEVLRNNSVGSALVRSAEQVVQARGCTHLALGLDLDNDDAARLYHRLGYHEWQHGLVHTH